VAYLVGFVLALAVSIFATLIGLDRDRAFYPTVLAVIASYYALFATMAGSVRPLLIESSVVALFLAATALGYRRNLWLIVAGLLAHGIFDFVHGRLIANPGVPAWWPMFCLTYDVTAAGFLAWLLASRRPGFAVEKHAD
jgi:hypothetical protein